jgi:hypothetical protein
VRFRRGVYEEYRVGILFFQTGHRRDETGGCSSSKKKKSRLRERNRVPHSLRVSLSYERQRREREKTEEPFFESAALTRISLANTVSLTTTQLFHYKKYPFPLQNTYPKSERTN